MAQLCRIVIQHQVERLILHNLRAPADGEGALQSACSALAGAARAQGLAILAPECPFLGPDEMLLLGHIAIQQRPTLRQAMPGRSDLKHPIDACVAALDREGLRLPYRAIQRLSFLGIAQ